MRQIEELRVLNDATINYLKALNLDFKRNVIISKILEDDKCFSKMKKNEVYEILEEIGIRREYLNVVYLRTLKE